LHKAAGVPFIEVHVATPISTCETRDPKGLYKKARRGELPDFTGVSAPYEAPEAPELIVDTQMQPIEDSVRQIIEHVESSFRLR
jgi:bifunctional enzyme CysN/CysC